jgi:hypothetical protein
VCVKDSDTDCVRCVRILLSVSMEMYLIYRACTLPCATYTLFSCPLPVRGLDFRLLQLAWIQMCVILVCVSSAKRQLTDGSSRN